MTLGGYHYSTPLKMAEMFTATQNTMEVTYHMYLCPNNVCTTLFHHLHNSISPFCIILFHHSAQLYFTICTTLFHHLGGSYIFKVDFCIELQRKEFFLKSLSNKFNAVFSSFFLTSSSLSQLCLAIYCRKILTKE